MDQPGDKVNRIDEVRRRLSLTAEAASSAEAREESNEPPPPTVDEIAARRSRRLAPVIITVAGAVVVGIIYLVTVRMMFPKLPPMAPVDPAVARQRRADQMKELERILNEQNIGDKTQSVGALRNASPPATATPAPTAP